MITEDNKLQIFENFITNKELPKYKKLYDEKQRKKDRKYEIATKLMSPSSDMTDEELDHAEGMAWQMVRNEMEEQDRLDSETDTGSLTSSVSIRTGIRSFGPIVTNGWRVGRPSIKERLSDAFKKLKSKSFRPINTELFFKLVKTNSQKLEKLEERLSSYRLLLESSKKHGQIALYEEAIRATRRIRAETILYSMGLVKVLTEESLVEFYKKSDRKVDLVWLHNFVRVIPEEILKLKEDCDVNGIFDNYVILTYVDPKKKEHVKKETEKEKQQRKDPILFGVRADSRRLYFIGDWEDEFCDLTLEKVIEQIGDDVIKANKLTAKVSRI